MHDLTLWAQEFEDSGKPNGSKWWLEADLRLALDYKSDSAWRSVKNKAMQACISLGLMLNENFASDEGGRLKLTRFACYLVAMNADPKKPQVAAAQGYLAGLAEAFQRLSEHMDGVERVLIRDEVSGGEKALASTAKLHGVSNYAFFQNAGYRGMYNMDLNRLKVMKGLPPGEKLLDMMGKEELAANLFRITQTDAKIKNDGVRGQQQLEKVAHDVGRKVRHTMLEISGQEPEVLPLAQPIHSIKKALKGASKTLREIDSRKPQ